MAMRVNEMGAQELTTTESDDWHLHLRDGKALQAVLPDSAKRSRRAIIMPNLKPPITTTALARAYRGRILAALPKGSAFEPLMTLYLTDNTSPDEIDRAADSGFTPAVKYYPAGATTNSDDGVTDIRKTYAVLERMQKLGMRLLVHGEVTDPAVDIFDREAVFIERVLGPLRDWYPGLKIVFEHLTTKEAVDYVMQAHKNLAATITAHHLLLNRNALFVGGIRSHHYCLPVLKREVHRQALLKAATSGDPRFFLGTDSAPHARSTKETACGCAGCYTAHASTELYAEAFEAEGALDRLEGFASIHGPRFYGLPRNTGTITLVKEPWLVPKSQHYIDGDDLIPLRAGGTVQWKLK